MLYFQSLLLYSIAFFFFFAVFSPLRDYFMFSCTSSYFNALSNISYMSKNSVSLSINNFSISKIIFVLGLQKWAYMKNYNAKIVKMMQKYCEQNLFWIWVQTWHEKYVKCINCTSIKIIARLFALFHNFTKYFRINSFFPGIKCLFGRICHNCI